jgi:hypothetical protein
MSAFAWTEGIETSRVKTSETREAEQEKNYKDSGSYYAQEGAIKKAKNISRPLLLHAAGRVILI